jgi:ATP-binding protein involved in chromosome partitioning
MLEVEAKDVPIYEPVRQAAEAALAGVAGVSRAQVVLTTLDPAPPGRSTRSFSLSPGGRAPSRPTGQEDPAPPPVQKPPYVRQVIAVASGKGGVGKSTVAVNLAMAFVALGYRTGLLDADVYGPSVPQMLNLKGEPKLGADRKLIPAEAYGLKAVSIGLLVKDAAPMIWRGPMASSALAQLLNDVAWGCEEEPLDLLIIDLPPGTGDIQLTLSQKVSLDGAVIVSTPQEVALIDVRRGAAMFQKTATPILGVIENMAFFRDPTTGEAIEIFGRGGARAVAETLGAPFLGEIPIDIALRKAGDGGKPVAETDGEGDSARRFLAMAGAIGERLRQGGLQKPPPRIRFSD